MTNRLPNKELNSSKPLSAQFIDLGITDFHQACSYIQQLSYGRNSDRSNWRLVLKEQKGSCSTKHALLKILADEINLDVKLTVGIYKMTEDNTPGVGLVLEKHALPYVPEAHCYLRHNKQPYDFTKIHRAGTQPIDHFLYEIDISPQEIGEEKVNIHKDFLTHHLKSSRDLHPVNFERLWHIREQCIEALSKTPNV